MLADSSSAAWREIADELEKSQRTSDFPSRCLEALSACLFDDVTPQRLVVPLSKLYDPGAASEVEIAVSAADVARHVMGDLKLSTCLNELADVFGAGAPGARVGAAEAAPPVRFDRVLACFTRVVSAVEGQQAQVARLLELERLASCIMRLADANDARRPLGALAIARDLGDSVAGLHHPEAPESLGAWFERCSACGVRSLTDAWSSSLCARSIFGLATLRPGVLEEANLDVLRLMLKLNMTLASARLIDALEGPVRMERRPSVREPVAGSDAPERSVRSAELHCGSVLVSQCHIQGDCDTSARRGPGGCLRRRAWPCTWLQRIEARRAGAAPVGGDPAPMPADALPAEPGFDPAPVARAPFSFEPSVPASPPAPANPPEAAPSRPRVPVVPDELLRGSDSMRWARREADSFMAAVDGDFDKPSAPEVVVLERRAEALANDWSGRTRRWRSTSCDGREAIAAPRRKGAPCPLSPR